MSNILVIDDCPEYAAVICDSLNYAGHHAIGVGSAHEAYEELKEDDFDLIICDMMLPVVNGPEQGNYHYSPEVGANLVLEFSRLFPTLPVIAISGEVPYPVLCRTARVGAIACLAKPFRCDDLVHIVERSLCCRFAAEVQ